MTTTGRGTIHKTYKQTKGADGKLVYVEPRQQVGWRAMWRDNDGSQRSKSFERLTDARRFLSAVETDLARGTYIDPTSGRVTFGDYAQRWSAAQHWRSSTRQLAESHFRRHIYPAFGRRRLVSINRTDVQAFVTSISQTLAPSTVEVVYRRLVSVFEAAVADRVIAHAPTSKIRLPAKTSHQKVVVLEAEEIHRLADVVPDRLRGLVWVQAVAGLRIGEALGLTVERIDLPGREITVDRQLVTVTGQGPQFGPPKTAASNRIVPIPDSLCAEISRHLESHGTVLLDSQQLLFANRDGRPFRRNVATDAWQRASATAALPGGANGWHVLRHSYASALIHAGLSVKAVQARLGHSSAMETLDTYSHLWPDSDDDTRQAVEAALAVG